jgi:hypothetical protein
MRAYSALLEGAGRPSGVGGQADGGHADGSAGQDAGRQWSSFQINGSEQLAGRVSLTVWPRQVTLFSAWMIAVPLS